MNKATTKVIGLSVDGDKFAFSIDLFLWELFCIDSKGEDIAKERIKLWRMNYPGANSKYFQQTIIRSIAKPSILRHYDSEEKQGELF